LTRSVAVTSEYSLPAPVRRPNTDERRACQADPHVLVICKKWALISLKRLLRRFSSICRGGCATIRR
jgi:hypothetical protein